MRIYNSKKQTLNLPLSGNLRINIAPHSVSGDILASTELLSLLVRSYDYSEIALIVTGPSELNLCANVSGAAGFVVQTLDEAIERFAPKPEVKAEEPKPEVKVEEPKPEVKAETSEEELDADNVETVKEKIKIKAVKSKKNQE